MFWIDSRPNQALVWGQAGGSLRADSAGVWWSSMPFERRTQFVSYLENRNDIEGNWHSTFGDRKNEIVFIGQQMDENKIKSDLDACLIDEEELSSSNWKEGYKDNWPIEKVY